VRHKNSDAVGFFTLATFVFEVKCVSFVRLLSKVYLCTAVS